MQAKGSKTGLAQQVQGQQEGQYFWIRVREWRAGIRIAHIQYHLVDQSFERDTEPLEGFWANNDQIYSLKGLFKLKVENRLQEKEGRNLKLLP